MTTITRIEITHHRLPLDPPFPASWDPQPRTHFPATIVRVHDDAGPCRRRLGRLDVRLRRLRAHFIGEDPLDLDRHAAVLANIEFHAGRPWPLDVALWDLAGQISDRPVWDLRRRPRSRGCGPTPPPGCTGRSPTWWQLARRVRALGFPALKVRFGRADPGRRPGRRARRPRRGRRRAGADGRLQPGLADAVGRARRRGTSTRRRRGGEQLAAERGVLDGGAAAPRRLRRHGRAAPPGRHPHRRRRADPRALRVAPSCSTGLPRRVPARLRVHRRHHRAAAPRRRGRRRRQDLHARTRGATASGCWPTPTSPPARSDAPFIEFPFDPPEWTTARRDFLITDTIEVDGDGWITLSERPGLGCTLDTDALARTMSTTATFA